MVRTAEVVLGVVRRNPDCRVNTSTEKYWNCKDEEEQLSKMKALQLEAMECLTGSKEYQAQLKAVKTEFKNDETEAGADRGDAQDSKPPDCTTRLRSRHS